MEHKWLLAHGETLREKHPKFRRMLNHLRQMNTKAFAIAVLEELFMLVVITVYVFWGGPYAVELWTAVFMAFSIHLIVHIGQSIVVRGYVPGFVTSILLLPFSYLSQRYLYSGDDAACSGYGSQRHRRHRHRLRDRRCQRLNAHGSHQRNGRFV